MLKEMLHQMFILGTGDLTTALNDGLGGVIFFSKDIKSENEFKNIIKNINKQSKIPPFLSIDQEGGRVERTENIYPKRLSAKQAYIKGEIYLKKQTRELAQELKEFGINLNFAPCIDVNTNPSNPIIGERSFSNKTDEVVKGGLITSNIYKEFNIIPCIKHYPGHGNANADSHLTLPRIDLPLKEMETYHIKPFKELIQNGADMVMVAHLHCTCFDKEIIPTSLSKNSINYLRNTLNFDGVIISDDMVMQGIQYEPVEACLMGIQAGLNMFIYREANQQTRDIINTIYNLALNDNELQTKIKNSYQKIIHLKKKYKIVK